MNKLERSGLKQQMMTIKILTPVYIGGNSENNLKKYQYIYNPKSNQVITIDDHKLMVFSHQRKLMNSYKKFITVNSPKRNPESLNSWFKMEKLDGKAVKEVAGNILDTKGLNTNRMNDISRFICDIYKNPYLPGSSLKGAIRTAIASQYILKHPNMFKALQHEIKDVIFSREKAYFKKKSLGRLVSRLEADLFSLKVSEKIQIKTMTGLSVADSEAFSRKELCLVKKQDFTHGKDDTYYLPIFRECLKPGSQTRTTITFDRFKSDQKFELEEPLDIFGALDDFKELLIGKAGIMRVFSDLDDYLPAFDETAGLLFLGGGAGYQSKTLMAALFPDVDERLDVMRELMETLFPGKRHLNDSVIAPRTLKLADYGGKASIMGLCELSEDAKC